MQDLNALYYFVKAVEHGGFAPASRALGIPKSKLSRHVAMLEEQLGIRLVHRSTRHFRVTDVGQSYYERCNAMLVEAEAAQQVIDSYQSKPQGTIRVTCPIALLHAHVGVMLAQFMRQYPDVTVHLEASNRRVDVLAEGVDVAIRVRPPPLEDSDLVMRVLSDRGIYLVASPELIAHHGRPNAPEDLYGWPSLGLGVPSQKHQWSFCSDDATPTVIEHTPRFVTTDMVALRNAALAGVGVVQLPGIMITSQLSDGTLEQLLPDWKLRREIIHAVFPSRRGLLPAVRALIDFLAERYAAMDED